MEWQSQNGPEPQRLHVHFPATRPADHMRRTCRSALSPYHSVLVSAVAPRSRFPIPVGTPLHLEPCRSTDFRVPALTPTVQDRAFDLFSNSLLVVTIPSCSSPRWLTAMLHIVSALYFLARLFFAQPLIPPLRLSPSSSHLKRVAFCLYPLPLLLFAPTSTVFLSYFAASIVALRFAYHHPDSLHNVPFWRRLFWRVDIVLYFTLLSTHFLVSNTYLLLKVVIALIAFAALSTFAANLLQSASSEDLSPTSINLIRLAFSQKLPNIHSFATVPPTLHNTSLFVLLTFRWVTPMLDSASSRPMQHDDISEVEQKFCSESTSNMFHSIWHQEKQPRERQSSSPSLLRALSRSFGWRIMMTAIPKLFADTLTLLAPIVLRKVSSPSRNKPARSFLTC